MSGDLVRHSSGPLHPIQWPGKCLLSHSVVCVRNEEIHFLAATNKDANQHLVVMK